jgi:hypothetical protein
MPKRERGLILGLCDKGERVSARNPCKSTIYDNFLSLPINASTNLGLDWTRLPCTPLPAYWSDPATAACTPADQRASRHVGTPCRYSRSAAKSLVVKGDNSGAGSGQSCVQPPAGLLACRRQRRATTEWVIRGTPANRTGLVVHELFDLNLGWILVAAGGRQLS